MSYFPEDDPSFGVFVAGLISIAIFWAPLAGALVVVLR